MIPFSPAPGKTVNINVAASTANVLVTPEPGPRSIRIMNDGTATVWIEFGKSSGAAASLTTSFPVAAGATEVMTAAIGDGPIYAAAIAAGATGKVYFTPGSGI